MKNHNLFLILILAIALLPGCSKKQTETTKTDGKTDVKTEVTTGEKSKTDVKYKELDVTAETPYHLFYETVLNGKMYQTVDYYSQGKNFRMKYKRLEPEYKSSGWEHFYDENNIYIRNYYNEKRSTGTLEKKSGYLNEKYHFDLMFIYLKDNFSDFKKTGTDTALGYMCNVYKYEKENITYYLYKDIVPVKIIAPTGTYTAAKIETGITLEDNFFTPPKGEKFIPPTPVKGPTRIG